MEIIDRALLRLRKYPDRGELYYEILTKQFIYRFNSTEKEMLEELNMERSVFYWICYSRGVGKAAPTNFRLNPDKVPTESLLHSNFVPAILATVAGMRQNNSLKARCLVVLGNFYSCH